jgi:hypothetical protein
MSTTTTDLVPVVEAEIVDDDAAPLSKNDARALDKQIRAVSNRLATNADKLIGLMEQAVTGQIHVALEYASLTAYFSDAVTFAPTDKDERKLLAAIMNGQGLSQRAIASVLGVSTMTVNRDLSGVTSDTTDTEAKTTSIDNKQHPRRKQAAPSHKPKPPSQPVDDAEDHCPDCGGPLGWKDGTRRCWPCFEGPEDKVQRAIMYLGFVVDIVTELQDDQNFTDEQHHRIVTAAHELTNVIGC